MSQLTGQHRKKLRRRCRKARRRMFFESLEERRLLATLSAQDLPDGLLSWWAADSGADRIGSRNGTFEGRISTTAGMIGPALTFDGTNDFVDFGNVLAFERDQPFSFDFWIKQEATVTDDNFVIAKQDNGNPRGARNGTGYAILTNSNGMLLVRLIHNQLGGRSNWLGIDGTTNLRDGKFHHVAVTYDGSSSASGLQIYVDGQQETTTTVSDTLSATIVSDEPLRFGAREGATIDLFDGVLDEIHVFERALSSNEVRFIYDAARRDFGDAPDGTTGTDTDGDGVDDGIDRSPNNDGDTFGASTYNTLQSNGGPSHVIVDGLFMGQRIDNTDGLPSYQADGDDRQTPAGPNAKPAILADVATDFVPGIKAGDTVRPAATGSGSWRYLTSDQQNPTDAKANLAELQWDTRAKLFEHPDFPHSDGYNGDMIASAGAAEIVLHPTDVGSLGRPTRTVARWIAGDGESGKVNITGRVRKFDTRGGDGVRFFVFVDGAVLFDSLVAFDDDTGVRFALSDVAIQVGSTVDFVVDANGRAFSDSTRLSASITATGTPSDDDGVLDPQTDLELIPGTQPTVTVAVTNNTAKEALLAGWIDYNADGVFDNATERATTSVAAESGATLVTLQFPAVPENAAWETYARFRFSTDAAFTRAPQPTGNASDGEVEDYGAGRKVFGWDNDSGNRLWTDPGNWSIRQVDGTITNANDVLPGAGDDVRIAALDATSVAKLVNDAQQVRGLIVEEGATLEFTDSRFAISGDAIIDGTLAIVITSSTTQANGVLSIGGNIAPVGTLRIVLAPGYTPAIGDRVEIVSAGSRSGTFRQVDGRFINATTAWDVAYTATGITLSVVSVDEAAFAEILRNELNQGIQQARSSLASWFAVSELGVPGTDQRLGIEFAEFVAQSAASLLPTINQEVSSLVDLRSELELVDYSVDCIQDGATCPTDTFVEIGVAERVESGLKTASLSSDVFATLSNLPAAVELTGTATWNSLLATTQLTMGVDTTGFYIGDRSQFGLSVEGEGTVRHDDVPLPYGGLTIDVNGELTTVPEDPIVVTLTRNSGKMRINDFTGDPASIFAVTSSGETELTITHTLNPTGLQYTGTWIISTTCLNETCELQEQSSVVNFPAADDWLQAGVSMLGSALDVLLGRELTDQFDALSLPLITDVVPTRTALPLFGPNVTALASPNASWMSDLFGLVQGLFMETNSPTGGMGLFGTEGDALIGADQVRADRSVSGSGIKIGVISTGAAGLPAAMLSGDLPTDLTTLRDDNEYAGNGTAMLEVIHDMAPDAPLLFAAAPDTDSLFEALYWLLESQQVDIVVSDVVDYADSLFAPTALSAYIRDQLAARDVLFVQAAGNDGGRSYRGELEFVATTLDGDSSTRQLHQFGGTTSEPVTTLAVTIAPQTTARFIVQTDQPLYSQDARVVGGATALPESVVLSRLGFPLESTAVRAADIPGTVDSFTLANHSTTPVTVELFIELLGGGVPTEGPTNDGTTEFQLIGLGDVQFSQNQGPALLGAALLDEVLVVGAAEINALGQAAPYSSPGSAAGRRPDIVGPAGVETSGLGTTFLQSFRGTAAAAAHAAAVAALLKGVAPDATRQELMSALKLSATAIGSGANDPQSGAGMIDAVNAAELLVPLNDDPAVPPQNEADGYFVFFDKLAQTSGISIPTEETIREILLGNNAGGDDLLQFRVTLSDAGLGNFNAEWPFNFAGIGSFEQFEIAGRVGITAQPDISLLVGWDGSGWYLDVLGSRVAVDLTGTGEASGVAFQTFGVGAGATLTATPYLDLSDLDRGSDGRIRQDDLDALVDEFAAGNVGRVVPTLEAIDADLYGDVILGFLDYVDIDRQLPNQAHGGDPFIIRGRTTLKLDLSGSELDWAFSDFVLANPDIDSDGAPDYTLGALAENAIRFGESVINAIEVPDFVSNLLGDFSLAGEPRRADPLVRPRGILPREITETPDAIRARAAINAHIANALADANTGGGDVDQESLRQNVKNELVIWIEGDGSSGDVGGSEGESHSRPLSILEQLKALQQNAPGGVVDDAETLDKDEFEDALILAIGSYTRWLEALAIVDLQPSDVVTPETLQMLETQLTGALRYAIKRAHFGAIELQLQETPLNPVPLNHQFETVDVDGKQTTRRVQRGVIDRAIEAVRWAQTAELLDLANADNGLSVTQALDELVIRVVVDQVELAPPKKSTDNFIEPDDRLLLEVKAGWQIKLPSGNSAPNIDDLAGYNFAASPTRYDADKNISVLASGAGNNNLVAGDRVTFELDPITGLPPSTDPLPIVKGVTDAVGSYRTTVQLGEGDTQAQVQVDVGLQDIGMVTTKTNIVLGRPSIELLAAHGTEDDAALRKNNLIVEAGGLMAVQARIRRGNGPLADAPLNFYLLGGGSLDQIEVTTERHIPRTSTDGTATIFYTSSTETFDTATIGVAYFENGTMYRDTVQISSFEDAGLLGQIKNPLAGVPASTDPEAIETVDAVEAALDDTDIGELTDEVRDGLKQLLKAWFDSLASKITTTANAAAANPAAAIEQVRTADAQYIEWLTHAEIIGIPADVDRPAVEGKLIIATEAIAEYWLGQFDGTASQGGLTPLYRALSWASNVETLLLLRPELATPERSTAESILARSGVEIELLPPTEVATSALPQLTGTTDAATLQVSARIVRRAANGSVVPVMQTDTLPAPVEVQFVPAGLANVTVAQLAGELPLLDAITDIRNAKSFIGSRIRYIPETDTNQLVAADQVLTATASRGPGEPELKISVGLGIPGILLETRRVVLRDPPQLTLRAASESEDDSALRKTVVLAPGAKAVLQAALTRNEARIDGEIEFSLIGRGALSQTRADTGALGVAGGITFTAPATPAQEGETGSLSVVIARYLQDGQIYTDSITVHYQFDPAGDDNQPVRTPDHVRANRELELALREATTINAETQLPEVDQDAFFSSAVEILRDWWLKEDADPAGEGSVIYWLEQVQADGAHAIDTTWQDQSKNRDPAYRTALEQAIDNWFQWRAVAAQLGVPENAITQDSQPSANNGTNPQTLQYARELVSGALNYAIDRVHTRCQTRANEYIAAGESTPDEIARKEELLAQLIIEGNKGLDYFGRLQTLVLFENLPTVGDRKTFEELFPDACYQVEIVDAETFLAGTTQRANLQVKAGIRIAGVPDLILPPTTASLVVDVRPVDNATIDGLGLGRTNAAGIYDRTTASIGAGDEQLAVDVAVVFDFDNLDDPKAKRKARTRAFTTKRVTLDTVEQIESRWAPESDGLAQEREQPRTAVDGERVLVETVVTNGRAPVIGKPVYVTILGQGKLNTGLHTTDTSGRVRLYFTPPAKQIGRTQIAFAFQRDGETVTEVISVEYTTSRNVTRIDRAFSEAQSIALATAGLHLGLVAGLTVAGADPDIDLGLLETAQRGWLNSGLKDDGAIDPDKPIGLRRRIQQAADDALPLDTQAELARDAVREYLRWSEINEQLDIDSRFDEANSNRSEFELKQSVDNVVKDVIDRYVTAALAQQSAVLAQQVMRLTAEIDTTAFLAGENGYQSNDVIQRLGYEIRVDEARLHGDAKSAWVQAVVRVYLRDAEDPTGPKVRAAVATPIDVTVVPLGFRLVNARKTVTNSLYGAQAYIADGDTDLELVIRASDAFAESETINLVKPGKYSLGIGARREADPEAPLAKSLTLLAGEQARVEGIVQKGLGRAGHRDVLFTITGAPADSITRVSDRRDAFIFTPPVGETGTATIMLTLQADGVLHQQTMAIEYSSQTAPEGETDGLASANAAQSGGLLNNSNTVNAFNELNVPLAQPGADAQLGSAFGFDSIQLPFGGNLPSSTDFSRDLRNWFSNSFDLLHIVDFQTIIGFLNGGLPVTPEELVRLQLNLDNVLTPLPPTLLAADFSGLLPDGFEGSVRLDRPELNGQIVFGIDTSPSPFYVLTRPDDLASIPLNIQTFFDGSTEDAERVGGVASELVATFGVAGTFRSSVDLVDGLLAIPRAESYLSTKIVVDFTDVAAETGKLRFDQLDELANLRVGFDGNPIDSFQAIVEASFTLPDLSGDTSGESNQPLIEIDVVGAIHKPKLDTRPTDVTEEEPPWQFQLRTGKSFSLPPELATRLSTATVDLAATSAVEKDDRFEENGRWQDIEPGDAADLGTLSTRTTIGGQDPARSDNVLALADAADWFRFQTTDTGNASSFVQVDFDRARGDLDLGLYRLMDDELIHVRTDATAFGDRARLTLLGQGAGTYFVRVFDDRDARNPFYALTIDPPGRIEPGIEARIANFSLRDTALEINVDSNLAFSSDLSGRVVVAFGTDDPTTPDDERTRGEQDGVPIELAFRASIDTNAADPDDNGGLHATITSSIGGDSLNVLHPQNTEGNEIPVPSYASWNATLDATAGGYLIFDYQSPRDFKFAGLDAPNSRWVIGQFTAAEGWQVSEDARQVANLSSSVPPRIQLVLQGARAELSVKAADGSFAKQLSKAFPEFETVTDGRVGLGARNGNATFDDVTLVARDPSTVPDAAGTDGTPEEAGTILFQDAFSGQASPQWQVAKGIWRVEESESDSRFVARSTSIDLGEWLLIDSAQLVASLDVQFNDDDIFTPPPIVAGPCDALNNIGPEGCVTAGIDLSNVQALLFRVEQGEPGTPLYPDNLDSPKGMVAIRGGNLSITPAGVTLGAESATAGLQGVLFVTINDAKIDLTSDMSKPLLSSSDISFLVPYLSEDVDFVTLDGNVADQPLFGLSKPTLDDPIPEFLLFQDQITINFNTELIQRKLDVNNVFPSTLENVGLRFNDAGSEDGAIGNLADFDLLVTGQIDFENSIFDFADSPFAGVKPIFAIGQPAAASTDGRVSDPSAYKDTCDESIDTAQFPDLPPLCKNGFVSAELNLGALVSDNPLLALKQLGPFYIGFQDLTILKDAPNLDGSLTLNGLVELGAFGPDGFDGTVGGSLEVVGNSEDGTTNTTLGSLSVSGQFIPTVLDDKGTPTENDDEFVTRLELDWIGEASGNIGSFLSVEEAALNIHTEFVNRATTTDPFNISATIEPRLIDTGSVCVDLGEYISVCGSGVINVTAGNDEPLVAIRSGELRLSDQLGPLSKIDVTAGGLGIGRDGTIYVLPAGYTMTDSENNTVAEFEQGAFIELSSEQQGGLFGFPQWVPLSIRALGLQFNGVVNPDDPDGDRLSLDISPPGTLAQLGESAINSAIALTDPENLTLMISGGLDGNEMFPVTSNFERIRINLGKLAGCVAVAARGSGVDLEAFPGQIFDAACDFPIEGLAGINIGIEPMDLGPLSIGGGLGFGAFTFERPTDSGDLNSPTEPQTVFYGKIEGELAISDIGVGVELIITQYGPVLARLKAGVPIPIGTLVGAFGGPVGGAAGTASGMLITGLEGGLVFDADPLPVVQAPTDIFDTPQLRTPLAITTADIENSVRELALQNPTFSELVALATSGEFAEDLSFDQIMVDLLRGRIPNVPVKFTWDDGFRVAVSGTITNQYVAAQVGLGVTLGINVGYDFDALLPEDPNESLPDPLPSDFPVHPNGNPAMDAEGYALDAEGNRLDLEGNPVAEGVTDALAKFDDLFGFQLFGFADLEVFGFKLAGAGLMLDFADPINPVFNLAAALPGAPSLLSMILPSQGEIGVQLSFDGYLEGSILASLVFLERTTSAGAGFFHEVLTVLGNEPTDEQPSPLASFARQREADRRQANGLPLLELEPRLTGYRPVGYAPELDDPNNPARDLWKLLLDIDNSGVVEPVEDREITRQFVLDRVIGTDDVPSILPDPLSADFTTINVLGISQVISPFVNEIMAVAPRLLTDDAAAVALTDGVPFWSSIEAQMRGVHEQLLLTVDDAATRASLEENFRTNLNAARVAAAFSSEIAKAAFDAGDAAAQRFAEIVNPSLRINGQLSPMILGIPVGPPSQSVDVLLNKNELTIRGEFSTLAQAFGMVGLPALVKDRTDVDIHLPFENLLADLYRANLPTIDPLGDDWRVGLGSSLSVLGLEISNSEGLIFPANATTLLEDKLQVYYPPGDDLYDPAATIEPDRILVLSASGENAGSREDYLARLLDNGGILVDGRLTLPRLITEPQALLADLQADTDYATLFAQIARDCDDVFSCMASHPSETLQIIASVPDLIGTLSTIEEVSQAQLFVPNFIDDVIASLDQETRAELERLADPTKAESIDPLIEFIQRVVRERASLSANLLQDAYLLGSYGALPEPFGKEAFVPSIPDPDDPAKQPFPTTSKILGVELGSGRLTGEVTETGFDLDLTGIFLGLSDVRFELKVDTSGNDNPGNDDEPQPAIFRAGAEFVLGHAPEACGLSPTAWQGAEDFTDVSEQLLSFLARVGLTDELDVATGTIGAAFNWLNLDNLGDDAGACLRAFSPGFEPDSDDALRRVGGIEAFATVGIENLIEGDFEFQIWPSAAFPLVPNFAAKAFASQVLLPGLEMLAPNLNGNADGDSVLSSQLELSFNNLDGVLSAEMAGTISLFGHDFTLDSSDALTIHSDGIEGAITLTTDRPLSGPGFEIDGDFELVFDTRPATDSRPQGPSASIVVSGSADLPLLNFSLQDATLSITADANGLTVNEVRGKSDLFSVFNLPPDAVSRYQAEGDAKDSTGFNDGTLSGGVTFGAGKVGQAFDFDGVNDFVEISDTNSLDITQALTIEGWVRPRTTGNSDRVEFIVNKGDIFLPNTQSYGLWWSGESVIFRIGNSSRIQDIWTSIPADQWSHVAGTYDGQTMRLFINGQLVKSNTTLIPALQKTSYPLLIGTSLRAGSKTAFFDGLVDELSIYDRALDQTEIESIANQFNSAAGLTFNGGFGITPSLQLSDVDLTATAQIDLTIGPGNLHGDATIVVDSTGLHGDFSGYGTVFGVPYGTASDPIVAGNFDSDGCLTITAPVDGATFELPGSGAHCGEARNATAVLNVAADYTGIEGDPENGSTSEDTTNITIDVTLDLFVTGDAFKLTVPWILSATDGASAPSDFILPASRTLVFDQDTLTQSITIGIVRDRVFEPDESFSIKLDRAGIIEEGSVTLFVGRDEATVTIQNDDEPDLSELLPPSDTLTYFTFDSLNFVNGRRISPDFVAKSIPQLSGFAPLLPNFEVSEIRLNDAARVPTGPGLPLAVDDANGAVRLISSNAAVDTARQSESYFEFTVDPKRGGWLVQGLYFFGLQKDGGRRDWELRWNLDQFAEPIMSSDDPLAGAASGVVAPNWTRYKFRYGSELSRSDSFGFPVQGQQCTDSAVTFRLTNTSGQATDWQIDNLAITGKYYASGCTAQFDTSRQDIADFLRQQEGLLPGRFEINGPGEVTTRFIPEPGNIDPDPRQIIEVSITGTSPGSTSIAIVDDGTNPPANQVVPLSIRTDNGVFSVDLRGADNFRGDLLIGGTVTDAIYTNGLADGAGIAARGTSSDPLRIYADASFGDDVTVSTEGIVSVIDITGGWGSGLLHAGSVVDATVRDGNFGAAADIDNGFGTFEVIGGDFASPDFQIGGSTGSRLGLAGSAFGPTDRSTRSELVSGQAIRATAIGGVGGSILGQITLAGSLGELSAAGGSIDATVNVAGQVNLIYASVDPESTEGGSIGGVIQLDSVEQITSIGGTITASVTTLDRTATTAVDAIRYGGRGGVINSPNSLHFAGNVSRISANQINLRVEAGGTIDTILATANGDSPALLTGRFTAQQFGDVRVVGAGEADFSLRATGEAWEMDGRPAFDTLVIPTGDWLEGQLLVQPGVQLGKIIVAGRLLDFDDPDSLGVGNGFRLQIIEDGLGFRLYVVAESWQNYRNAFDVNDDSFVSPIDVLIILTELNDPGSRSLARPSILTTRPPNYIDTSGDGFVSPIDALLVITELNRPSGGEGEATLTPPELHPSTRPRRSFSNAASSVSHGPARTLDVPIMETPRRPAQPVKPAAIGAAPAFYAVTADGGMRIEELPIGKQATHDVARERLFSTVDELLYDSVGEWLDEEDSTELLRDITSSWQ